MISVVPEKNMYGLTWMRFGILPQTSSRSSMMATMESPQGNTDLWREGRRRYKGEEQGKGRGEKHGGEIRGEERERGRRTKGRRGRR